MALLKRVSEICARIANSGRFQFFIVGVILAKVFGSVFAERGMGFFAGSLGGDDIVPGANQNRPPKSSATGVLTGRVTELGTSTGIAGVPVTLAFQGEGIANPTAVTAADGTYSLGPVPAGTYPKLTVIGAGYDPIRTSVQVGESTTTRDFAIRRDWAAISGGAKVAGFNGPDLTEVGCGPGEALDTSQAIRLGQHRG